MLSFETFFLNSLNGTGCSDPYSSFRFSPELPAGEQTIIGAEWMLLEEMSELDQIYLWASGLKAVPEFYARLNGMKK